MHPGRHQREHRHRLRHDRRRTGATKLSFACRRTPPWSASTCCRPTARRWFSAIRAKGRTGPFACAGKSIKADPDRYFYPDQYNNPANWKAHYNGTALEILAQTDGRITHFVACMGTSGTFMGNSRRLREEIAAREVHFGAAFLRVSMAWKV